MPKTNEEFGYVDGKDVAEIIMNAISPIIAERNRLAEENKKLKESNKNLNLVLSRCGVGYKA